MGLLALIERWWNAPHRRARRLAGRELDALFARRDLLAGSSLRPDHRSRVQILDLSGAPGRIGFGIVRHPRPYHFSRQFHEVIELYVWHAGEQRLERVKGINLTRRRRSDGDPQSFGTGV